MALINCPECGKEISSNAKVCPHCGCEITVCPDCNSVYTQNIETCPNCGHVFSRQTQPEKQDKQEDFTNNIANKMQIAVIMKYVKIALSVIELIFFLLPFMIIQTLPKNDAAAYLDALNNAINSLKIFISISAIALFGEKLADAIFLSDCNILHKLCANEMTMHDIIGVQYCKEHEYLLSGEGKKTDIYRFALNAAYRQEDKSAGKYNLLLMATGVILAIIETICLSLCIYQIYDNFIYCTVWEIKFNFWKSINYAAAVIAVVALILWFIIQTVIEQKYSTKMQEWCENNNIVTNVE